MDFLKASAIWCLEKNGVKLISVGESKRVSIFQSHFGELKRVIF